MKCRWQSLELIVNAKISKNDRECNRILTLDTLSTIILLAISYLSFYQTPFWHDHHLAISWIIYTFACMKKKIFIAFVGLLSLLSCSEKKLPNYPATDDGITRMRLDSASFFTQRHDTRNAMYQLKAAEKPLFNVNTDTLKFTTYYHIALLNAQNGAYKLALNYFNHAAKYANDSKRSHRQIGRASCRERV